VPLRAELSNCSTNSIIGVVPSGATTSAVFSRILFAIRAELTDADSHDRARALLEYARSTYGFVHDSYGWLEQKAARYVTVLVFVIGSANLVLVPEVFRLSGQRHWTIGTATFVVLAVSTLLTAIGSVLHGLRAMRPESVPGPPSDRMQIFQVFKNQTAAETAEGEAHQLLEAASSLRATNETRGTSLKQAYRLMMISIALYAVTLLIAIVGKLL